MGKILVVNPNSSRSVTESMRACTKGLEALVPHRIEWKTNEKGPAGIETDAHVGEVVPHLQEIVASSDADAFVVGCFSDPAVPLLRHETGRPVVGLAEAACRYAMSLTRRFGIISIVDASVVRHRAQVEAIGIEGWLAGDRALQLGVAELGGGGTLERLRVVGQQLRDDDGAEALILGCAGLGRYRSSLEAVLEVPVIDPVMASVAHVNMALMLARSDGGPVS
ncbi:aspartate/glutamate racemase family protein [Gluconacetobacter tumulisoli]|uniref:Hydantoin racemase n=1 Tax=Gluconacetobacter tumulisoli TaxID=1286189 RepID=A0A7W4PQR4_9PROT|nr:aspartate/glutamate racemase family protein [Gluconacetobacter tumulisoli]MBB2203051.1 hydantoin racemase [Gluconacetobacter tumulisoli]